MKLSADQERVTLQIKSHHMQIIGVAGCGKTTTNLFICQKNSDKNILLLTYNSILKNEYNECKRFKKVTQNDYGLY